MGHNAPMTARGTLDRPDDTRHRIRLLAPALLLAALTYPVTELHPLAALLYALLSIAVLTLGARVAAVSRWRELAATAVAAVIALLSVPWVMFPEQVWLSLGVYGLLVVFHLLVIAAVLGHLLAPGGTDHDVLVTGTSLYALAGALFVPAAMIVHQGSALVGEAAYRAEGAITWQRMVHFSFTTLTTVGSGDVAPATATAQALAAGEAMFGVLIVALIIGRLAGAVAAPAPRRGV